MSLILQILWLFHQLIICFLGRDKYYFVKKKTTLILTKSFLKLISKCLSFWLTTYLLSLVVMFFNRQSAFQCVLSVLPSRRLVFLYSYEAYFIQGLLKKKGKKLTRSFSFMFRYIDDVLSVNNCKFGDFIDHIYPIQLEINVTTDTAGSASYLDLPLEVNIEGRLRTKLYDKRLYNEKKD